MANLTKINIELIRANKYQYRKYGLEEARDKHAIATMAPYMTTLLVCCSTYYPAINVT